MINIKIKKMIKNYILYKLINSKKMFKDIINYICFSLKINIQKLEIKLKNKK